MRWQFLGMLGPRFTFLTFYPAVAVAALYGGLAGGLTATVVSAALADYFWIEPVGRFEIANAADVIGIIIFLMMGTFVSCLAEAVFRAQARANRAEEQSRFAAEREKAAVELQQSESRYRELVQNANSAIIRWKRDGTITFINEYAQRFFGYGEGDIIGKHVSILLPERDSTGASLRELVQRIVDHPEKFTNNINENILRDGVRVWMAWTNRPVFDRDGQLVEILAIGSDITGRKRAEDEIQRRNAILNGINRILQEALTCDTEKDLGRTCLEVAEEITQSKISFIGEIGSDGLLHDIAMSNPGWDLSSMYDESGRRRPPGNFKIRGLFGCVLLDGASLLVNDPSSHPDSIDTPEGHPPLSAFLGVPLSHDGKTIGMVGLANRDGGYAVEHQHAVEAIAPAIVQAFLHKRAEQALESDLAGLIRMHDLSGRILDKGGLQPLLDDIMEAAVATMGAELGTLQLFEGDSLRIVAAHGHKQPFLEFFEFAENRASVCGEAMRRGERTVVSDVETSPLFAGTPSLAVLREAGVRAVQSTPMISRAGLLLGIITTQWGVPYTPTEQDLWRIDLLARQAADLIEHSQNEEALEESEERLRISKEAAMLGLYDYDFPSGLIDWDKRTRELWAVAPDLPITYEVFMSGIHPEDREHVRRALDKALDPNADGKYCSEFRVVGVNDGVLRWVAATGRVFFYQGRAIRLIGTVQDISGQKSTEEELRRSKEELELRVQKRTMELEASNQALQDFAFIAAHDLQEPLRKVKSFGDMLQKRCGDSLGELEKDYLDRMLRANDRMQSLLVALREYSRLSTEAEPFVDVELTQIVHDVLSDMEIRIKGSGGEVLVGELPVIKADPTQMRQLFQNIIANALKFHKEGEKPVVEVRSAIAEGKVQITVEDNGIGFEEQYVEKIFAPFHRLHGRSEYEGTGMGLAICKKIVERHGGSITAKSAPGAGASFIIRLPALSASRL